MKATPSWQAVVIGAVVAVAIGTLLVVGLTFPFFHQELGSFIVLMYLMCFWACTPALLLPFVTLSVTRRVPPRRVLIASLVAGTAFPIALGVVFHVLPYSFRFIGLVSIATLFDGGDSDVFNVGFWLVLTPFALVIGTALAHTVLRRDKENPAQTRGGRGL